MNRRNQVRVWHLFLNEVLMMKQKLSNGKKAYLYLTFAGPSMLFFFLVVIIPLIYGVYLTFTD